MEESLVCALPNWKTFLADRHVAEGSNAETPNKQNETVQKTVEKERKGNEENKEERYGTELRAFPPDLPKTVLELRVIFLFVLSFFFLSFIPVCRPSRERNSAGSILGAIGWAALNESFCLFFSLCFLFLPMTVAGIRYRKKKRRGAR